MSDGIDWMKPIEGRLERSGGGVPLWGDAPKRQPVRSWRANLSGIREEQLRRAAILQKAAKGAKVTKANARFVVERLALVIPGMRYTRGPLVVASLAPTVAEIYAASPDPITALPGNPVGRTVNWSAERLSEMLDFVEARMAESRDANAQNALLAYHDKVLAERGVHLSLKTLSNKLAEARGRRTT